MRLQLLTDIPTACINNLIFNASPMPDRRVGQSYLLIYPLQRHHTASYSNILHRQSMFCPPLNPEKKCRVSINFLISYCIHVWESAASVHFRRLYMHRKIKHSNNLSSSPNEHTQSQFRHPFISKMLTNKRLLHCIYFSLESVNTYNAQTMYHNHEFMGNVTIS